MSARHAALIDEYEAGAEKLALAVRGLTAEDLLRAPAADAPPEVGRWSIHEVVIHLADAEAAMADRMKRVIAEDGPTLMAWDETRFAANLHYKEQSAEDASAMIALTRRQVARVLRRLPDAAFDRAGTHSERGRQTLEQILSAAVEHLEHHLRFVRAKRAAMGKGMW